MAPTAIPLNPTNTSPHLTSKPTPLPTTPPTTTTTNPPPPSSDDPIPTLSHTLSSETTPLAPRFRALFALKTLASTTPPTPHTLPALHAIATPLLTSPSALLKHELAYCLGQTGNLAAAPYLRKVLENRDEDPMCRHEAAEALGALGDEGSLELLRGMSTVGGGERERVVRETCEIAVGRIEWVRSEEGRREVVGRSDFVSVDPAPASPLVRGGAEGGAGGVGSVKELGVRLMDVRLGLFERYRAMFALRDLASPPDLPTAREAVEVLGRGLLEDGSALFRHEVAFVFGQLCHPASVPVLKECLGRREEVAMVRHEAAEALGSLGEEEGVEEFLRGFLTDEEVVVRESVVVALDMAEEGREMEGEGEIGEGFASRHREGES